MSKWDAWRNCNRARCIYNGSWHHISGSKISKGSRPVFGAVYLISRVGEAATTEESTPIVWLPQFMAWFEAGLFEPVVPLCDRRPRAKRKRAE